jgi:hypothetical protein
MANKETENDEVADDAEPSELIMRTIRDDDDEDNEEAGEEGTNEVAPVAVAPAMQNEIAPAMQVDELMDER